MVAVEVVVEVSQTVADVVEVVEASRFAVDVEVSLPVRNNKKRLLDLYDFLN